VEVEAQAEEAAPPPPRLRDLYRDQIVPSMMREFGFANPMQVPRVQKIVLNIGVGEALTNARAMESATRDLATISGQKPIITRARKSIAAFKVREGNPIGTTVTLRASRMYYFLDRLIYMALPRIRDFRGIPRRGFDGRGNFSIGIREQIIFPEIDYNQIDRIRGLQVTITTNARNDAEAMRLLELYGMPFMRQA
jgi:large subunit ribosomal protein L5